MTPKTPCVAWVPCEFHGPQKCLASDLKVLVAPLSLRVVFWCPGCDGMQHVDVPPSMLAAFKAAGARIAYPPPSFKFNLTADPMVLAAAFPHMGESLVDRFAERLESCDDVVAAVRDA